jgi:hypothetical protein
VGLALSQLDCIAVAPTEDPLAEMAAREAREILERDGAGAYLRQLDALLADRAPSTGPGAPAGHSPAPASVGDGAPVS